MHGIALLGVPIDGRQAGASTGSADVRTSNHAIEHQALLPLLSDTWDMSHLRPPEQRAWGERPRDPVTGLQILLVLMLCVCLVGGGLTAFDSGLNLRNMATGTPLIVVGLGIAILFSLYLSRPLRGSDMR